MTDRGIAHIDKENAALEGKSKAPHGDWARWNEEQHSDQSTDFLRGPTTVHDGRQLTEVVTPCGHALTPERDESLHALSERASIADPSNRTVLRGSPLPSPSRRTQPSPPSRLHSPPSTSPSRRSATLPLLPRSITHYRPLHHRVQTPSHLNPMATRCSSSGRT